MEFGVKAKMAAVFIKYTRELETMYESIERVALISNCGNEVGKALIKGLHKKGMIVIGQDSDKNEANLIDGLIKSLGGKGYGVEKDLTSVPQIQSIISEIIEKYGRIDVLINNFTATKNRPLLQMDEASSDFLENENLKTAFLCSKEVSKYMVKEEYGRIINIDSCSIWGPKSGYSIFKGGLQNLSRSLALELAEFGVTSNFIAPGLIKFSDEVIEDLDEKLKLLPLNRVGTPDDIVNAVLFFAADEARYITGQTLQVCGGNSQYSSFSM